jgi:hypothetical protein
MPLTIGLWKVAGSRLHEIPSSKLDAETRLEQWIIADPSIIGLDALIIGHQLKTEGGGFLDVLAMDSAGDLVLVELKKDRTPREVVAQILDYASWVKSLTFGELDGYVQAHNHKGLAEAFFDHFGDSIPESVNASHSMMIVASELDDSSQRIVEYLAEEYGVSINAVFFSFFMSEAQELLARAWLLSPTQVQDRVHSKRQAPWSGYWFANVGEGDHRNWEDSVQYGFLGAGQGPRYSRPLKQLSVGDKLFAYMKGLGYVGYGEVTSEARMIKDFQVASLSKALLDLPLRAQKAAENSDNADLSEWAVGVKWLKTFTKTDARTFKGVFANQNIVCKIRHEPTVEFLRREFGVAEPI